MSWRVSSNRVALQHWNSLAGKPLRSSDVLLDVLTKELSLKSADDHEGFDLKLGEAFKRLPLLQPWRCRSSRSVANPESGSRVAARRRASEPTRSQEVQTELARFRALAGWKRKIPEPMGVEEIVYGDKIICVQNHGREVWDSGARKNVDGYLANGEIGVAVGQFKSGNMTSAPWALKVEFSRSPDFSSISPAKSDFGDEARSSA